MTGFSGNFWVVLNFFLIGIGRYIGTVCILLTPAKKKTLSFTDVARALSRNWQDRRKADALLEAVESRHEQWANHDSEPDGSESSGDY